MDPAPADTPVLRSRFGRVIKPPERYSPELSSGEEFEDDYSDDSGSDEETTTTAETSKESDDDPDYVEGMETEEGEEVISTDAEDSDTASEESEMDD